MTKHRQPPVFALCCGLLLTVMLCLLSGGCRPLVRATDRDVAALIEKRQREALDYSRPAPLSDTDDPLPEPGTSAYQRSPNPRTSEVPEGFYAVQHSTGDSAQLTTRPAASAPATTAASAPLPASQPTRFREKVFTLTDALAYAQQHQREYQAAKEDLYLAALALTLERHLWTPQFAADVRQVYGNFGEITDFDQATRFAADLSVAQRLPYGGEFTAAAVSTLIRDVKRSITATEGSQIQLGLDIPFLRGAGHVAQEDLIQLERSLTYAVRTFERFRRSQLVEVARLYFGLLASKQAVIDTETGLRDAERHYERAKALEEAGQETLLVTGRAEAQLLERQNDLARQRESFRAATDRFKIAIGMSVDELIGLDDLETIGAIERQIVERKYPLLVEPPAAKDDERATAVAGQYRLDLLNRVDQIEDAKRGVAVAKNALLPDLDWTSSLTFDTDPEHYKLAAFEHARATWRTEVALAMNDRFSERNQYRASLIDVRRARRSYTDQLESIRAQVLSAVNQIRLQARVVEIQRRNLEVADKQREFAQIQFEDGLIDNEALVDAENQYIDALNRLSQAKTSRWTSLLEFRLATGTLRVDENGQQQDVPALHEADSAEPGAASASQPPAAEALEDNDS
jgi:outer membrane protein TolC